MNKFYQGDSMKNDAFNFGLSFFDNNRPFFSLRDIRTFEPYEPEYEKFFFKDLWDEYYNETKHTKSEQRWQELQYQFNSLSDLHEKEVDEITVDDILKYSKSDFSYSWRSKQIKLIRSLIKYAIDNSYLKGDVSKNIRVENFDDDNRRDYDFLSKKNIKKFFDFAEQYYPHLVDMFRLAYYTGMRIGEVRRLEFSEIQYTRNRIVIRGSKAKTRRRQDIYIDNKAIDILKKQNKRYKYVFPNPKTGKPYSAKYPSKVVSKILKKLGLYYKGVGGHIFRKSFITHLIEDGVDPVKIQKLARHKDIRMTYDTYNRISNHCLDGTTDCIPEI